MKRAWAVMMACILALAVRGASAMDASDMFSKRDKNAAYDERESVMIYLDGDTATCDSDAVAISGSTVTITDEGTYVLTGKLENGMIIVDCDESDKPQIVLSGANIHSGTCAALYVLEADKVIVTLAADTENALTSGDSFVMIDNNNIDGAVFSKKDLSFNGTGALTVDAPCGHGIVCKDDLVFAGGVYTITSASHGIDANDSVRATSAVFAITAGKDGIHAENSDDSEKGFVYIQNGGFTIIAEGDGISAGAYLWIAGGDFSVTAGGGSENAPQRTSGDWGGFGGRARGGRTTNQTQTTDTEVSAKGLKAAGDLIVDGGAFALNTKDDGMHANASVTVSGGSFSITSGDDGIHADDTLTISSGSIDISKSYEGIEGLYVYIQGGDIRLTASDDGVNAAGGMDESGYGGVRGSGAFGGGFGGESLVGSVEISGGNVSINASGDGIDANGTLTISGGAIVVSCPTSGDTAVLDFGTSGVITGGTFIGTGALRMAQTFDDSAQGVIAVNVGDRAAGTRVALTDAAGHTLIEHITDQRCAIVILSSPDIVKGETYTLAIGADTADFAAY